MSAASPWVSLREPRAGVTRRLFCFPHAGGGATAYRQWLTAFPADLEICPVQLPGREQRLRERPFHSMAELLPPLLSGLLPWLDRPFSFFGHSMGAVIAYELSHRLRAAGLPTPQRLLVSAHRAPQCPRSEAPIHELPEQAFLDNLATRNGSPRAVLDNAELMALLLPMLRADFRLIETYRWTPGRAPLDCPLTAFGGVDDATVSRQELLAWGELSRSAFRLALFPGGHFYWQADPTELLAAVRRALTAPLAPYDTGR